MEEKMEPLATQARRSMYRKENHVTMIVEGEPGLFEEIMGALHKIQHAHGDNLSLTVSVLSPFRPH